MAVATWQDVATALGQPASSFATEQQEQFTYWLDGVELIIRARLGDVAALDQDALRFVETETVADKARRLSDGGASSVTVAIDDGSVTRRFERVSDSDITDSWWNLLDPNASTASASIRPGFEPDSAQWAARRPPFIDSEWWS